VRLLLAREGIQLNKPKEDGATPLYVTCGKGLMDIVRLLLTRKEIKINQAKEGGATPLLITCQEGHVGVVRLLLARKDILINQADDNGNTPLSIAQCQNHTEIVSLLQEQGKKSEQNVELGNEEAIASLSMLDEIERGITQANDGGVVGETKSNGGVVDD
jgi:ankyrin repeat protein